MSKLSALLSEPHHLGFAISGKTGTYDTESVLIKRDWYNRLVALASPPAVAAPFPDNEGDDIESEIIREVLTEGRQMLAHGLQNLLMERLELEMYGWRSHLSWHAYQVWLHRNDHPQPPPNHTAN